MMNLGWSHPEVVAAVQSQLLRTPMPSQELIDPLRGVLAKLMADITPGDLKYSWFAASGTEAIEAAIKFAKVYTRKPAFIVAVKAFHGKTMASLSMMGKADYRQPVGILYGGPVYHVPFGDAGAVEQQLDICDKIGVGVAGVLMSRFKARQVPLFRLMTSGRVSVRRPNNTVLFLSQMKSKPAWGVRVSCGVWTTGTLSRILLRLPSLLAAV